MRVDFAGRVIEPRKLERCFGGFSLLEVLIAVAIVAILASVAGVGYGRMKERAYMATSSQTLRQLGGAAQAYSVDHYGRLFPYRQRHPEGGVVWWFGYEDGSSGGGEGQRGVDRSTGPLGPYIDRQGEVQQCPGMVLYERQRKEKFSGASFGYGYNIHLGGGWMGTRELANLETMPHRSANVAIFATSAQVNTFQAPASPSNPMIEEFYGFDRYQKTIHFRFNGQALLYMASGEVKVVRPAPGTMDDRIKSADVGRFSPVGSKDYLGVY